MATSFTSILERVAQRVPGAVAVIFVGSEGEAVDQFPALPDRTQRDAMLVLGAHYGVILRHVQSLLHLFHFGEAEEVILRHDKLDIVLRTVGEGHFVVLAVNPDVHLGMALREMRQAAGALRLEMV